MPHPVKPYAKLAAIYDHVMRHVQYRQWSDFVLENARRHGCKPKKILELACGTGTVARELFIKDYPVFCMDLCYGMLQTAQKKSDAALPLVQADMRALPFRGRFDLVLCLYDSINYLMAQPEIHELLCAVRRLLAPPGLFIFDICTEYNSRKYFMDYTDQESGPDFHYERRSRFLAGEQVQVNEFKLFLLERGKMQKYEERHQQRIYQHEDIAALIKNTGLYTFKAFDGFSFNPPHARSTRIHYVLKPAPPAA